MPRSNIFLSLTLCLLLAACAPAPLATPTPTPTLIPTTPPPVETVAPTATEAPTLLPAPTPVITPIVTTYLAEPVGPAIFNIGTLAQLVLVAEPVLYSQGQNTAGNVVGTFQEPWPTANVAEMQTCLGLDTPCEPAGEWVPFEPQPTHGLFGYGAATQQFEVLVDWAGPRSVWLVAQFRDADHNPILALGYPITEPHIQARTELRITGVWAKATPLAALPTPAQTAIVATQTAYPVQGSVLIADGICCMGGTAGQTLQAEVNFTASSSAGTVPDMRVRTGGLCFSESDMSSAPWEPFVVTQSYPVFVAINWVGFYVSVQYRDAAGNLSPVFCDDISVEGMPAVATP